ncbi:ras association domain-containing protein 8-like isoform X1 [Xiphophorus maculatus]|uniref:Ras association domain family member 8b n=1 Tax=Xiphophorus maculatus TaxID=8083 RepID=M4AF28_XIPMA|nr:ras association domain-containing protein 8-like isoform X1 [Xiphophorus maculatus]XP_023205960.1 ras association domain-containing protein 8-like isoform X1 [Xiphophorus maculatus]XP_023205961.1 ras association domain-containing protein 8-like isoform X1 [Xiphophorus maculatus]
MKVMELKVWVDGVQRIVCGVTEFTTCQEVVIALAQAIGRTGRYTLIEKWRDTERHLAPHENPVVSLNKWGQYASDVQLILQRTGPSVSERPTSEGLARVPERGLYRQSLPPLAKLRPAGTDGSLKRREPKRKSLTFTGGARGLREIFGKSKDTEAKQPKQQGVSLNLSRVGGRGTASVPGSPARELSRLVQLQRGKLQALESRLQGCEAELRDWEEASDREGNVEDELLLLEQQVRRNDAEVEEEEFWQNELHIEQESERRLRQQLVELRGRVRDCESKLSEYLARIQSTETGLEKERLQQEAELNLKVKEEEVQAQLEKVRAELDVQSQQTARLESSCKALERSLCQSGKRLQEKEQELEQLTKELRQVNLQQFIQQTGTKVTVLPAQPAGDNNDVECGSLKRLGSSRLLPSDLRALQSRVSSSLNPEGIYV